MSAIRIAAVAGSLVVLGIILSPVSPLTLLQSPDAPQGGVLASEPIDEASIAPAEVTPEVFAECNSVNDGVQTIVAQDGSNETRKIAADLLLGEYCNRPQLVQEISTAADPGRNLVAYACDAASGRAGDRALQESLSDHTAIYCESARTSILEETDSVLTGIEGFREDFMPELEAAVSEDGSAAYDIEAINSGLDKAANLAQNSEALLASEKYYEAAKMLESASAAFNAVVESI